MKGRAKRDPHQGDAGTEPAVGEGLVGLEGGPDTRTRGPGLGKSALQSRFYMINTTHVSTIDPAASAAELLSVRAARRGQDRLAASTISRRAVLRYARSPGV